MVHNQAMPRYVTPIGGERAEGAISVLGNGIKAGIIRYLRQHPNVTKKPISDGLGVPAPTLSEYLRELEEAGLLLADPPRESRTTGEWPVYRVNVGAVTALYLRLGQELGEI